MRHGQGTYTYKNGNLFKGQYVNDVREGIGEYTDDGNRYQGGNISIDFDFI